MTTETYGFFGSAAGDPRQYVQTEFAEMLEKIFRNGYFAGLGEELQVAATDPARLAVRVASGQAWINGYYYKNTAYKEIDLDPADSTNDRIDRIVLRLDTINDRTIEAVAKTGIPGTSPSAPSLERTAQVWELSLATVLVRAGVTSIAAADITDTRSDDNLCGVAVPKTIPDHASRHAKGGADPLTPAQIGAATQAALNSHVNATDNPHNVTPVQIGAVDDEGVNDIINQFGLGVSDWETPPVVDLNDLTTSGLYIVNQGSANTPDGDYGHFVWVSGDRASSIIQEAIRYSTTGHVDKFIRRYRQGTWYPWERVWNSGNLPNPASTDGNYANLRARATTKSDVGLSNVDNVRQASKSEFDSHAGDTNNPHNVNSLQVTSIQPMADSVDGGDYPTGLTTFESTGDYPEGQMSILNINPNHSYRFAQIAIGNGTAGNANMWVRTWRVDEGWSPFRVVWGESNNTFTTGITGYQRLADGSIRQRMRISNAAPNTDLSVNFPITFPGAISGFQFAIEGDMVNANLVPGSVWCIGRTASSIRVMHSFESDKPINIYIEVYGY